MRLLEIKTFRRAISPIIVINWIFGVDIFEQPVGRRRPILSAVWSILHLVFFLIAVKLMGLADMKMYRGSIVVAANIRVRYCFNIIVMMLLLYHGHRRSKIVSECLSELGQLNDILKRMSIPKNYNETFKFVLFNTLGIFVVTITFVVLEIWWGYEKNSSISPYLAIKISFYHSLAMCFVVEYTFAVYVGYIGQRLWDLNEHSLKKVGTEHPMFSPLLREINLQAWYRTRIFVRSRGDSTSLSTTSDRLRLDYVREIKKIHRAFCKVAEDLTAAYGTQISCSITLSLADIGFLFYEMYSAPIASPTTSTYDKAFSYIVGYGYWILFIFMKLFYLVNACAKTSSEARRTVDLVYEAFSPTASGEMKEEIRALSFQLLQNPLHFTAGGILALDYALIFEAAGFVVTYLVVMIQLHGLYESQPGPRNSTI